MKLTRRSFLKFSAAGVAASGMAYPQEIFASVKRMWTDGKVFLPGLAKAGDFINQQKEDLLVTGYPVSWWADTFGLPLSINYAPDIHKNIRGFKDVFKKYYPKAEIRYAAKANTHPTILSIVREEGIGADVASENEMRCALQAKINSKHLDVNGNSKTDTLIEMALKKDMLLVADSIEEFLKISELAKRHKSKPRVILRLSGYDLTKVTDEGVFTAGKWCKFGTGINDLPKFYSLLPKHPHIDFLGFHTHIGSQITDVKPYLIVLGKLIEFSATLNKKGGNCRMINIGGGFPVSYYSREQWNEELDRIRTGFKLAQKGDDSKSWVWGGGPAMFMDSATGKIDLNDWSGEESYSDYPQHLMVEAILIGEVEVFGKKMNTVKALRSIGEPLLVVEPGRSITETSGVILMRIKGVRKFNGDHNLVTMDAGAVNYDSALEKDYLMRRWTLTSGLGKKDAEPFDAFVAGRLCYNADIISWLKIRFTRKPRVGDTVLISDSGAYSSHFYAANTNSFPRPARVICYEDGSIEYLKREDTYDEIFSL